MRSEWGEPYHKNDKEMTYDILRQATPAFSGLRSYIEKCCAKLDSSTMLAAAPPCRLDISRQNFKSIGFYCSPLRAYIAKCCKKVAQDTAPFCSLPCRLD